MAGKNPISLLQERSMRIKDQLPQYDITSVGTLEVPRFKCHVKTLEVSAEAEAGNKKDAKQKAAENALEKLGYKISRSNREEPVEIKPIEAAPLGYNSYHNYIGLLNEYASGRKHDYPIYQESLFPENGQFKIVCHFLNLVTEGFAPNKKEAKRLAAFKMLERLKDQKIPLETTAKSTLQKPPKSMIEIDSKDNIIMQKFEELSINTPYKSYRNNSNSNDIKPHPHLLKKDYSVDEAGEQLLKLGYDFQLKTIQMHPFIVAVQLVGKEFTLMGCGDTEAEAKKKVLNDSIEFIREGCYFGIPDRHLPLII